jgi:hypothetical protein
MYTPKDHLELAHSWEARQLGTCAPACIAVIHQSSVQDIVDRWEGYLGYANLEDLENQLELVYGIETRRMRGNKSKSLTLPPGVQRAIARIQWENPDSPDGKWGHWVEAQRRTHFLVLERQGFVTNVFCNGHGWFNNLKNKDFYAHYLDGGHITSFLVV